MQRPTGRSGLTLPSLKDRLWGEVAVCRRKRPSQKQPVVFWPWESAPTSAGATGLEAGRLRDRQTF